MNKILEEVDGRQLLGEALRLAMQSKRGQQGYIRRLCISQITKMFFKDEIVNVVDREGYDTDLDWDVCDRSNRVWSLPLYNVC